MKLNTILALIVFILISCLHAKALDLADNDLRAPLHVYLDGAGVTNAEQLLRPSQDKIRYLNVIGEKPRILKWDVPNIPEPSISQLLPNKLAKQILDIPVKYRKAISTYPYFTEMTDNEKAIVDMRDIINEEKLKTVELKKIETELFKLLRNSLNLNTNEYVVTKSNLVKYLSNTTITNIESMLKFAEIQKNIQLIGIINTGEVTDIYDHEYLSNTKL